MVPVISPLSGAKLEGIRTSVRVVIVYVQFHLIEVAENEFSEFTSAGLEWLDGIRVFLLKLLLDLFKEGLEVHHELLLRETGWCVLEVIQDVINELLSLLKCVSIITT